MKLGKRHSGFTLYYGNRVFFNLIGPGQSTPVVGVSLFGLHLKAGAGFADLTYVWQNKRSEEYISFGIKTRSVSTSTLEFSAIDGTIGDQISLFFTVNVD